jgi:RNA polymerase sigma-70 factor (ECF subfamily)
MHAADRQPLDDEALVQRVLAGDSAAYAILVRRHAARLFRAARAITQVDADAEEVVQQTYVRAWLKLDQFAGAARFSTWLTRIAINQAIARTRQRGRYGEVELRPAELTWLVATEDPEDHAALREHAAMVAQGLAELPERYREIVLLRDVQELSVTQTAERLAISEDNVKIRLHRAKAMLRERCLPARRRRSRVRRR